MEFNPWTHNPSWKRIINGIFSLSCSVRADNFAYCRWTFVRPTKHRLHSTHLDFIIQSPFLLNLNLNLPFLSTYAPSSSKHNTIPTICDIEMECYAQCDVPCSGRAVSVITTYMYKIWHNWHTFASLTEILVIITMPLAYFVRKIIYHNSSFISMQSHFTKLPIWHDNSKRRKLFGKIGGPEIKRHSDLRGLQLKAAMRFLRRVLTNAQWGSIRGWPEGKLDNYFYPL
jgi:hypothetical protein